MLHLWGFVFMSHNLDNMNDDLYGRFLSFYVHTQTKILTATELNPYAKLRFMCPK